MVSARVDSAAAATWIIPWNESYASRYARPTRNGRAALLPVARLSTRLLRAIVTDLERIDAKAPGAPRRRIHGAFTYQLCRGRKWCGVEAIGSDWLGIYRAKCAWSGKRFDRLAPAWHNPTGHGLIFHPVKLDAATSAGRAETSSGVCRARAVVDLERSVRVPDRGAGRVAAPGAISPSRAAAPPRGPQPNPRKSVRPGPRRRRRDRGRRGAIGRPGPRFVPGCGGAAAIAAGPGAIGPSQAAAVPRRPRPDPGRSGRLGPRPRPVPERPARPPQRRPGDCDRSVSGRGGAAATVGSASRARSVPGPDRGRRWSDRSVPPQVGPRVQALQLRKAVREGARREQKGGREVTREVRGLRLATMTTCPCIRVFYSTVARHYSSPRSHSGKRRPMGTSSPLARA